MKHLFPTLYSISLLQVASIALMGGWRNGLSRWGYFGVHSRLLQDPDIAADMDQLLLLLHAKPTLTDNRDGVVWNYGEDFVFTVVDCFSIIANSRILAGPQEQFNVVLALV